MPRTIILTVCFGAAALAAGLGLLLEMQQVRRLRGEVFSGELRIAELERQFSEHENELAKLKSFRREEAPLKVTGAPPSLAPRPEAFSTEPQAISRPHKEFRRGERALEWSARQAVTDIEEHVALTPEQRGLMVERLKEERNNPDTRADPAAMRERQLSILEEVAGIQAAQEFDRREAQARQIEFDRRVDEEVVVLGRSLALSPGQEQDVRSAIISAEQQISPLRSSVVQLMREAMATHMDGDAGKERLQGQYDDIKKLNDEIKQQRDQLIFSSLDGKLSDEQRNALLAFQSSREAPP